MIATSTANAPQSVTVYTHGSTQLAYHLCLLSQQLVVGSTLSFDLSATTPHKTVHTIMLCYSTPVLHLSTDRGTQQTHFPAHLELLQHRVVLLRRLREPRHNVLEPPDDLGEGEAVIGVQLVAQHRPQTVHVQLALLAQAEKVQHLAGRQEELGVLLGQQRVSGLPEAKSGCQPALP